MKHKRVIILIIILCLILIPTGYARLKTNMKITGLAQIIGKWDIKITDIKTTSVCENCDAGTPTFTETESSFDSKLIKPGDSITYELTITNNGNIDAILDEVIYQYDEQSGSSVIKIVATEPSKTLNAGDSTTIFITIYYDESATVIPSVTSKNFDCHISYVQA